MKIEKNNLYYIFKLGWLVYHSFDFAYINI